MPWARTMHAAYSVLGVALTPAIHVWLKRRVTRGKEDAARIRERFGFASTARPAGTLLWVHAASVGEVHSVLPLLGSLLAAHPALHLLITSGTVTSAALVAQCTLPRTVHQFVPVDSYPAVRRFYRHWRPDVALWVESEFWPQLLLQAQAQHLPMLLVNARISERSFNNWQRHRSIAQYLLQSFCSIYAGSTADAERLRALGAADVHDIGNLKYDAPELNCDADMLQSLTQQCAGRMVFVAASTHANEEQLLAQVHQTLLQQFPTLLTVIVPRHAARGEAIAADLRARGIALAQRSSQQPITAQTQLYLADTMGELGLFYRLADLVFMGGSLIAHGGQNPLEAARLNNAILTGPHTHNFAAIIARFVAADAIRITATAEDLAREAARLLADAAARQKLAQNAAALVASAKGASAIIAAKASELIARAGRP